MGGARACFCSMLSSGEGRALSSFGPVLRQLIFDDDLFWKGLPQPSKGEQERQRNLLPLPFYGAEIQGAEAAADSNQNKKALYMQRGEAHGPPKELDPDVAACMVTIVVLLNRWYTGKPGPRVQALRPHASQRRALAKLKGRPAREA